MSASFAVRRACAALSAASSADPVEIYPVVSIRYIQVTIAPRSSDHKAIQQQPRATPASRMGNRNAVATAPILERRRQIRPMPRTSVGKTSPASR